MMMMAPKALTFYGLNVVRAFSLISLILVFSSTIFVMVNNIKAVNFFEANKSGDEDMLDCDYIENSTVPNQAAGVFWAVVASLLIIFQTVCLFLSEIRWPSSFFDRYFPVLGNDFGLGPLGIFQALIATQILSHHVDDFTLVAAFFLFSVGCLNMLLGLIFRESAKEKRSITAWKNDGTPVLPVVADYRSTPPSGGNFPGSFNNEKADTWASDEKAGYGFGRMGEKSAGLRGFVLQKPAESLPRYATPPHGNYQSSRSSSRDSSRSSTSSFSSPSRSPRSKTPPARTGTPVFKSGGAAI